MTEPTYELMLDELYAKLPKKAARSERWEVPIADVQTIGTKTTVKNFEQICAYIRRSPQDVSKYLFKELAVPGVLEGPRLVLQGRISPRAVNERISTYVKEAVFCKECGKPDTNIVGTERAVRMLQCEACGARSPLRV